MNSCLKRRADTISSTLVTPHDKEKNHARISPCVIGRYYPCIALKGKLVCHYLDVGQGDSIFIELPNSQTMLIDSGENYHGAGIIKYIKKRGYTKIDYLVGTHPHSDHIGSMAYIVKNFNIGSVYMPKVSTNSRLYENLLTALKSKKLTAKSGKAGVKIFDDNTVMYMILRQRRLPETISPAKPVTQKKLRYPQ